VKIQEWKMKYLWLLFLLAAATKGGFLDLIDSRNAGNVS
jgi:hypothetical protein